MGKIFLFLCLIVLSVNTKAQFGQSLYTDGIQGYVVIPDNNAFDLVDDFTIECWVQAKLVDNLVFFRKGWCNGSDNSYYLSVEHGHAIWHWNETGNCNYPSRYETVDSVVCPGTCTHIAVVHSSTEIKIYVNNVLVPGTLVTGNYSTIHSSSNQLDIAAYRNITGVYSSYYWGEIDELRFWNYKLTQQEMIDYSNAPLNGDESGLVAYFDMEDTGVGNSLTITNKAIISGNIVGTGYGSSSNPSFVNSCVIGVNINILSQQEQVNIFPNPFENILNVNCCTAYSVEIKNVLGKVVFKRNLSTKKKLNLSNLKKGLYFITIKTEAISLIKKIVKL